MSDCKHGWIENMQDLGVDKLDLGPCPYCEIDRLKAELEEAQQVIFALSNLAKPSVIEELERQLAEARAEVERFKHMAEQNSTEMCEWMEKYNQAHQEAAREIVKMLNGGGHRDMRPWDIIGWIILLVLVLWAGAVIGTRLSYCVARLWLHYKTRNIPPKEGQQWNQDGDTLVIGRRYPAGHFSVKCGDASWGENDDEWKQRVTNRRLFLEKDAE